MNIIKFSGSAYQSLDTLDRIGGILKNELAHHSPVAVVISAGRKFTNELLSLAHQAAGGDENYLVSVTEISQRYTSLLSQIEQSKNGQEKSNKPELEKLLRNFQEILQGCFLLAEASTKTQDFVMSFGERLNALIAEAYIRRNICPAQIVDGRNLIHTDSNWGAANVDFDKTLKSISAHFSEKDCLQLVTGFLGSAPDGATTTLGRGGADYTASILGTALNATEIRLWTVVDGVMTADPKLLPGALPLESMTYDEAMELAHLGNQLLFPPTIQPAKDSNIPIRILNLYNPAFPGTLISAKHAPHPHPITGIAAIKEVALLRIGGSGLIGVAGIANRLFSALSLAGVNILFISQGSSEYSICVAFLPQQSAVARSAVNAEFAREIAQHKIDDIEIEENLSIIAAVGENMRKTPGIAARLFSALSRNGINSIAIAQGSSELDISVVVSAGDCNKALHAVHDAFFLANIKPVHLFIVGAGQVGRTLLEQIAEHRDFLSKHHSLDLRVLGIANSKRYHIDGSGIDLAEWSSLLAASTSTTGIDHFIRDMLALNLPNCVFVDCTASEIVGSKYERILRASVSIVTPNKKANSQSMQQYRSLRETARRSNVKFFYETNVGAGLPVIGTLNDLLLSGDEVIRIEAVLSGTLSYIFNTYKAPLPFSAVVHQAKKLGFTEPDPRDDLSGVDVARKLLILAREMGQEIELSDVLVESLVPPAAVAASSVDEFFSILESHDAEYAQKRDESALQGKVLRFIGSVEDGTAKVSLQSVGPEHPFYSLSGSDNIISFTTKRYRERPLVVKGPGAGTAVTAAGALADIVRVASYLS